MDASSHGADDSTLRLWDENGAPLNTIKGHEDEVNGAAILDDGRILSWSDDRTLRLWDENGAPLNTIEGHEGWVRGAAILDDGRILSWDLGGALRLWSGIDWSRA